MDAELDDFLVGLKALAESTRIRILLALSKGELNVSELTHVLGQSQPRVSRHLKLLLDAGLISRHKEGNWVLFRMAESGIAARIVSAMIDLVPQSGSTLVSDARRLHSVREKRATLAEAYFAANAGNWSKLRSLHVDETSVEHRISAMLGPGPVESLVDLGTGTGRMLELFAGRARRLIGIDLSREMLTFARANLERINATHAQVRQANLYALPLAESSADIVILHQVLHFLDEPEAAIREAARILKPSGKLLIADFAPHDLEMLREHDAHRRLGIPIDEISRWLIKAGLAIEDTETLKAPSHLSNQGLDVTLVLATSKQKQKSAPLGVSEVA